MFDGDGVGAEPAVDRALIDGVARRAEEMFAAARGSHDWEHTLRVRRLSEAIGRVEGADMTVVSVAACLHDIGRCDEDRARGGLCHAQKGAEMAGPLVAALPLGTSRRENILHCIRTHRYRGANVPKTLEAQAVSYTHLRAHETS